MPSTKAEIHTLTKEELIETLHRYHLDITGSIDDLRKRLKGFAERTPIELPERTVVTKRNEAPAMTDPVPTAPPPHLGETMNLVR